MSPHECSNNPVISRDSLLASGFLGNFFYRRPTWSDWVPVAVEAGEGDFAGRQMLRFYLRTIPGLLKDAPADAQFIARTDGQPLAARFMPLDEELPPDVVIRREE